MHPKIGIILVNYNGYKDTVECVESISKITYSNYVIIVVDNASTEKPNEDQLKYLQSHTTLINSETNTGFSGGNNLGIEHAKTELCDYVLLLNNDTTVEPDFLEALVDCAKSKPEAGIVCGKIRYFYEPDKIWFAGGTIDLRTCITAHRAWNQIDTDEKETIEEISFATGCLQLIPMTIINKVGLLSEEYFLYSEDADYCCRVMECGYKIIYTSKAVIYHKINASTGTDSPMSQYYTVRNSLYIIKKYSTNKLLSYCYFVKRNFTAIRTKKKKTKIVLKAIKDYLTGKTGKVQW